jgi:hypothetical protein
VDAVTQVVGCTERISEAYLMQVLEEILHQFPFKIIGFHSDNGSEYINHTIGKLLNKLMPSSVAPRQRKDHGGLRVTSLHRNCVQRTFHRRAT